MKPKLWMKSEAYGWKWDPSPYSEHMEEIPIENDMDENDK
jgi:hypothetical protein